MPNSTVQRYCPSDDNSLSPGSMATPSVYPRATRQAAIVARSRSLLIGYSHLLDSPPSSPCSDSSSSSIYIPTPRKMPRSNTKSKYSVSSGTRRMTRSMAKQTEPEPAESVLADVVNTVDQAIPTENALPTQSSVEGPLQKVPWAETVRDEETVGASVSGAPCVCTTFKKGEQVEVYMRTHGEWSWRAGKVANTNHFRPRLTGLAHSLYS
ncbi:hypothetical protein C8Q73DRAFT_837799 [Cubamyces lactineus]|nr:hypothetical protein C8Q73DRAFT_837799 [Cubamyces lactineus]